MPDLTLWSDFTKGLIIVVVTLYTFTYVKPIYLGQNSSRISFYQGKKFWEGHPTDIGSQGFHTQMNFLERKFRMARCAGI